METKASNTLATHAVYRNVGRLKINSYSGSERITFLLSGRNGVENSATKMTLDNLEELRDLQYAITSIIEDCEDAL